MLAEAVKLQQGQALEDVLAQFQREKAALKLQFAQQAGSAA